MRQFEVRDRFGIEHLTRVEAPTEPVGPGQVRLRMRAWSVNYRDLLLVNGAYDPRLALPFVPLSDGVGQVVELGPGVSRVTLDERVCPTFSPGWIDGAPDGDVVRATRGGPIPGVLAEELVIGEHELVRVPSHLTDAEAATLPCAGVTAWSALVTHARIGPDATVLVLGTGGVSLFAAQIARLLGARVVATTSTEAKAERLKALGVDHVVLHPRDPRWGRTVRRWSDGGVDLVVEVGGAGTFEQSLDAVRVGGTVAVIGNVAGSRQMLSVLPILMKQVRCQGVLVGSRRAFEDFATAIERHALRPVIDHQVPFEEAPQALRHLADGKHVGKIVISD